MVSECATARHATNACTRHMMVDWIEIYFREYHIQASLLVYTTPIREFARNHSPLITLIHRPIIQDTPNFSFYCKSAAHTIFCQANSFNTFGVSGLPFHHSRPDDLPHFHQFHHVVLWAFRAKVSHCKLAEVHSAQ